MFVVTQSTYSRKVKLRNVPFLLLTHINALLYNKQKKVSHVHYLYKRGEFRKVPLLANDLSSW